MLIPSLVSIENVHGYCNASCKMCSIAKSKIKPHIMQNEPFNTILKKFVPYINRINGLDIVGMGETLIDPGLSEKIKYAKSIGFRNISIATNAALLDEVKSKKLLKSNLDIILFSIDSLKKEIYEEIRKNLSFESVMENVRRFLRIRDKGHFKTKVFVRIIEQELNSQEWKYYTSYWSKYLKVKDGDMILKFPVHNWADSMVEKNIVCPYIFDRIVINSKGNVAFCCIDIDANFYRLGNLFDNDPVEIFNNRIFVDARRRMEIGEINSLKHCRKCDVPLKRMSRDYYRV